MIAVLALCSCGRTEDIKMPEQSPAATTAITEKADAAKEGAACKDAVEEDFAEYKLERIDESLKDYNGNVAVSWFFDKLVIEDSNSAADIIGRYYKCGYGTEERRAFFQRNKANDNRLFQQQI